MGVMTSRERLLAAIAHREVDTVPVSPRLPLWAATEYGSYTWPLQLRLQADWDTDPLVDVTFPAPDYIGHPFSGDYRDLPGVTAEITVQNQGDVNVIRRKIRTPAGDLTDEIAQGHMHGSYGTSPSPTHREPLVKSMADLDKLQYLLPDPKTVRDTNWPELREIIGQRGLLQVHPQLMMAGMTSALGISETMIAYYEDRPLFDRLLEVFGRYFQGVTKTMLGLGTDIVFASWHNFGVSAGWSPHIVREAFLPWIKADIDLVHERGALYHYFDNGKIAAMLPDIGALGPDIISTLCPPQAGDVELATAKRLIGSQVCLMGNVDVISVLQQGTPCDVREAVRSCMEAAATGSGFILSSSSSVLPGTPRENIQAYFAAAREFGRMGVA
jgi:hypothetical protein